MTLADPAAAVCAYLSSTIGDLLAIGPNGGPAIFRPTLPMQDDPNMAMACIVVRPAGGYKMFGLGLLPVADPTLDFTCYAASQQESYEIAMAAAQSLKQLQQSDWETSPGLYTKLYWARIAGGPLTLPDTQTLWPATWIGAQVMCAEAAGTT